MEGEAAWCSMEDDADEENEDESEEVDIAAGKSVCTECGSARDVRRTETIGTRDSQSKRERTV